MHLFQPRSTPLYVPSDRSWQESHWGLPRTPPSVLSQEKLCEHPVASSDLSEKVRRPLAQAEILYPDYARPLHPTPPDLSAPQSAEICRDLPPPLSPDQGPLHTHPHRLPYTQNRWQPPAHRPQPRLARLDDVTSPAHSLVRAQTASAVREP